MFHHMMAFRILMLGAMGLGALYMMHLLAQDYNKIRQPIAMIRALFRSKRDVAESEAAAHNKISEKDFEINWNRILKYDPMQCLQSLICQLVSGAEQNDPDGKNIKVLLEFSLRNEPPAKIVSAIKRGLKFKGDHRKCFKEYAFCFYSASTMLRFLRFFS